MQLVDTGILTARKRHSGRWLSVIIFSSLVAALAGGIAFASGHRGVELFFAVLTLFILMTCYSAFLFTSFANDLWLLGHRKWFDRFLPLAFTVMVYLVFSVGTQTFSLRSLAVIFLFVLLPSLVTPAVRTSASIKWHDWVAVVLIWIPFDFGLLKNVWLWPQGTGAYILNTAVAVCLAIYLFSSNRRISDIGFRLRWTRGDIWLILRYFLSFCALAIPFGYVTGFIEFNVRPDLIKGLLAPVGIFLFIAYPEELLFRGLLQNFIKQRFGSEKVALVVAAVFFWCDTPKQRSIS